MAEKRIPNEAYRTALQLIIDARFEGSQKAMAEELGLDPKDIGRALGKYSQSHMPAARRVADEVNERWPEYGLFPPDVEIESLEEWAWIQLGRELAARTRPDGEEAGLRREAMRRVLAWLEFEQPSDRNARVSGAIRKMERFRAPGGSDPSDT